MAAVPLVVSLGIAALARQRAARTEVEARLVDVGNVGAARISADLQSLVRVLRVTAELVPIDMAAVEANDRRLLEIRDVVPEVATGLHVYSADGRNAGSSHRPVPRRTPDMQALVQGRRYFQEARRTLRTSFGDAVRSAQDSSLWIISVAEPILGRQREFRGIVAAPIELRRLAPFLQAVLDDAVTLALLVDRDGTVLGSTRPEWTPVGAVLPRWHLRGDYLTAAADTVLRTWTPTGEVLATATVRVEGTPWHLLVSVPEAAAYGRLRREVLRDVVLLAIAVAVALLLATQVVRSIQEPVDSLARAAASLEGGALAHRAEVRSGDELGLLAGAFNRMAATLEERDAVLRQSESRYRSLFDHNPGALLLVDRRTRQLLDVNEAAARLFGRDRSALMGESVGALFDLSRLRADGPEVLRCAGVAGREVWAEGLVIDLPDTPGAERSLVALRDVTAERAAREALAASEAEVRQMQKLEAVSSVAASVAHDFNNILSAIMGAADVALTHLPAEGSPVHDNLMEIHAATERAAELTRRLLTFSRRQPEEVRPVDVGARVRSLEGMLRRVVGERVRIDLSVPDAPAVVLVDAAQFEQVVVNLVVNARDAMPEGGRIRVSVTLPAPGAGDVVLTVDDEGHGMDAETQRRMFEPFFTTKEVGRGTGLGLAVVQRIVEAAGGAITVRSAPGAGTSIRVSLAQAVPLGVPDEPVPGAPSVLPGASAARRERILVVDDNADVRRIAVASLRRLGYEVVEASSGEEALERFEAAPAAVDLVLTDVVMPGMTGRALSERLRAIVPDLPVIHVTGFTDDERLLRESAAGEVTVLRKPYSLAQLAARIRGLLDARRSRPG